MGFFQIVTFWHVCIMTFLLWKALWQNPSGVGHKCYLYTFLLLSFFSFEPSSLDAVSDWHVHGFYHEFSNLSIKLWESILMLFGCPTAGTSRDSAGGGGAWGVRVGRGGVCVASQASGTHATFRRYVFTRCVVPPHWNLTRLLGDGVTRYHTPSTPHPRAAVCAIRAGHRGRGCQPEEATSWPPWTTMWWCVADKRSSLPFWPLVKNS